MQARWFVALVMGISFAASAHGGGGGGHGGGGHGGGHGGSGHGYSANDMRSNSLNPNNEAYSHAMNNHSNQLNPNNPAYWRSRGEPEGYDSFDDASPAYTGGGYGSDLPRPSIRSPGSSSRSSGGSSSPLLRWGTAAGIGFVLVRRRRQRRQSWRRYFA